MVEARDITGVSFPFVAGVALAALLGHSGLVHALVFPSCVILLTVLALSERRSGLFPLLFFMIGMACWAIDDCTREFRPEPLCMRLELRSVMERFCAAIDSIPFRGNRTSALLQALLAGRRELLDRETVALFRRSGAAHMLALSGLHLGVVASVVSRLISILGRSPAMMVLRGLSVVAFSAVYVLMTGASPSLVRAFIFIVFNELSRLTPGRTREPFRIFCVAATLQLALAPSAIGSVSFQLSYLAMLGIVTVFPRLDSWYPDTGIRRLDRMNVPRRIWTSVALSVSCQLFTFPLMWYHFHSFPQYFMITNMIALPLTEILIVGSLPLICLSGMGMSPDWAVRAIDWCADRLVGCLEIISSM